METFIREFRTTNELLLKEQNNLLSELRIEVHGLSRVMNDVLILKNEVRGVTTREGKMTTGIDYNDEINNVNREPSRLPHDKPDEPRDVIVENEPQKTKEKIAQPSIGLQVPLVPFPHRLRKEKEEAQQRKFLENMKQLHINIPFIEVDKFVLPIDFVILDMPEDYRILIILGRPFLATARAMIDVFNKKITLRVGDDEVIFDMDQSMKRTPSKDGECYCVDELDDTINEETQELLEKDQLDSFLLKDLERGIDRMDLDNCSSINDKFVNDPGIESEIRHINLLDTAYSVQDVVKNEIVKLLDSGLIYPIRDGSWVRPIHVVPKKGLMTVVLNDNNELIPSRTIIEWRLCIDYCKMNDAIRKDHFPLPFIDQMLERLSGNDYYCFLEGFLGFFRFQLH
ncbi:DNA-directed DNA polymerase [Tanacetum coccineum]